MYDDYIRQPSMGDPVDVEWCSESRIRECLPEPGAVLEFVKSAAVG